MSTILLSAAPTHGVLHFLPESQSNGLINLFSIIFTMSLIYLAVGGRNTTFIRGLVVQGLLLLGIAFLELHDMSPANLIFILIETLLFKAVIVPWFLNKVVRDNHLHDEEEPDKPRFVSLFSVLAVIFITFILSYSLHDEQMKMTYFTVSVSTIVIGLLLIIRRRKIITHIVGYMVLENGMLLLSFALGSEQPLIVNIGILLDLVSSTLLFGIFLTKIGEMLNVEEIDQLNELKD